MHTMPWVGAPGQGAFDLPAVLEANGWVGDRRRAARVAAWCPRRGGQVYAGALDLRDPAAPGRPLAGGLPAADADDRRRTGMLRTDRGRC